MRLLGRGLMLMSLTFLGLLILYDLSISNFIFIRKRNHLLNVYILLVVTLEHLIFLETCLSPRILEYAMTLTCCFINMLITLLSLL